MPSDSIYNPAFFGMPEVAGDTIYNQGNGMATVVSQRTTRNNTYNSVYTTRIPTYTYSKDWVSENKDMKVRKWSRQKVVVGNYKAPTWVPLNDNGQVEPSILAQQPTSHLYGDEGNDL